MTFFLTTLPLWLSAVILIVPTTLLAMAGPVILRRYVEVNQLRTNNEVAGYKFATVGVLYAVLLAFAVVVVWEKFNQAESEVAKEAGAAATVSPNTGGRPRARSCHSRGDDRLPDLGYLKRLAGHGERHAKLRYYRGAERNLPRGS
jgi:hypothetical protein